MDDRALAHATAAASVSVKQPKVRRSTHKGNRACGTCHLPAQESHRRTCTIRLDQPQLQGICRGICLLVAAFALSCRSHRCCVHPQAPAKGSANAMGAIPCPPLVAVHRVRWNVGANGSASTAGAGGSGSSGNSLSSQSTGWLAHGGAAGLVCIQRPRH